MNDFFKLNGTTDVMVWDFLENKHSKKNDANFDILNALASLMYLIKSNALVVTTENPDEKDFVFMTIDDVFIRRVDDDNESLMQKWRECGSKTIYMCSRLSTGDLVYPILKRCLPRINENGFRDNEIMILGSMYSNTVSQQAKQYLDFALNFYSDGDDQRMIQPKELGELASKFLNVKGKSILNSYSGTLFLATVLKGFSAFTGYEGKRQICDFAKLYYALVAANPDKIELIEDDWSQHPSSRKYDIIVSIPIMEQCEKNVETLLSRFDDLTKSNGEMFLVLPFKMLSDDKYSDVREQIIEKNYVDTVIALPNNMLWGTNEKIAVLYLKKSRNSTDAVRMVDASKSKKDEYRLNIIDVEAIMKDCLTDSDNSISVRVDEIKDNAFILDALLYLHNRRFAVKSEKTAIKEVLRFFDGEIKFDETEGRVINPKNLTRDWCNYEIDVESLEISHNLEHRRKYEEPAIFLGSYNSMAFFVYCEASKENPIYAQTGMLAFKKIKTNVHTGYLLMELSKQYLPYVDWFFSFGFTLQKIVRIGFPSLERPESYKMQKEIYEKVKSEIMLSKAKQAGLEEVINRMKEEYINEVRSRKHDMMPHLRQIDSTNKLMDFRIKNIDEYDKDTFVAEMQKRLDNQRKALNSLYKSLEFFSRESRFGYPEIINLDKYLFDNYFEVEGQIGNISYQIDIDVDYQSMIEYDFAISRRPPIIEEHMTLSEIKDMLDKTPYYEKGINVYMAKDDLDRLCDNIIQNAITHGFTDTKQNNYNIWIDLSLNADKNMFQIDFKNNGNPFPTGMDKESYGTRGIKAGAHQGSGEGGYVVKSIVEHYGGDYEVISDRTDKGYVNIVRIFLPIHK